MPTQIEPSLKLGVLCEKVLQEKDGVISIVRVVDRFIATAVGAGLPKDLPPVPFKATVVMMWVNGLGNHEAQVRILPPKGEAICNDPMPFFIDSLERGHNHIVAMDMLLQQEGLYWVEFLLNGQVKSKIPLRVIFHRVEKGSKGQPE